ncbi:MAG TPA: SLC13 family permease [Candidatus Binatia bacterium]|nr:SLC13 family permease [Candidatus Binatia bacterium]
MTNTDLDPPHGDGAVVMLSGRAFVIGCVVIAAGLLVLGRVVSFPLGLLAAEVFATILGLFLFGSFKYQIHKNALTYGMVLIIIATFSGLSSSQWHREIADKGWWPWAQRHFLTFGGLDDLVHADTMLFILGLTFFVAAIAQTRLLEGITFFLLRRFRGAILPTVISVTAVVAFASGILDGVSMIGLTIRTLVIILLLAAAPVAAVRYAVMVCTAVTTICGIWLAYGEPPNLIMKANLHPYLDNAFFLRYCAPAAVASYLIIAWQLRSQLGGQRIAVDAMDVIDANAQDVRFLQASRHGEVLTPVELVESHEAELGEKTDAVLQRLRQGESLGIALVHEAIAEPLRKKLLGHFVSEDLAEALDRHYVLDAAGEHQAALEAEKIVDDTIASLARRRKRAQWIGGLALVPFVGLLIAHGIHHDVPLFLASFAGFFVALLGIVDIPKMRALALREARHEYAEYYFLFPLFLSITLLTQAGFFDALQALIHEGVETLGHGHVAFGQFIGCAFLSAILDNNVVADFASRALHGLDIAVLHLFAMAQIAGYALGGCWTHIGSAQSVVAFAFIRRDVDERYTPIQWIKEMTPVIVKILVLITMVIYAESALLEWLH